MCTCARPWVKAKRSEHEDDDESADRPRAYPWSKRMPFKSAIFATPISAVDIAAVADRRGCRERLAPRDDDRQHGHRDSNRRRPCSTAPGPSPVDAAQQHNSSRRREQRLDELRICHGGRVRQSAATERRSRRVRQRRRLRRAPNLQTAMSNRPWSLRLWPLRDQPGHRSGFAFMK